jgi:ABC-type transport system involved in Fe-S cluster assembly fused permease/ATPase subunit
LRIFPALDEATSALDSISDVIAHHFSTVIHANKIVVISNGQIVEQGTHKELLDQGGSYANLYSKQFEIGASE